jgi:hypothetical protein
MEMQFVMRNETRIHGLVFREPSMEKTKETFKPNRTKTFSLSVKFKSPETLTNIARGK